MISLFKKIFANGQQNYYLLCSCLNYQLEFMHSGQY